VLAGKFNEGNQAHRNFLEGYCEGGRKKKVSSRVGEMGLELGPVEKIKTQDRIVPGSVKGKKT